MTKKILVLVGGFSAERNVSLSSAKDVEKALKAKGYETIVHDLQNTWNFLDVLKKEKPDVVFNGLYGNFGEDGAVQGMLDLLQIPYTHSGMMTSALGMNKYLTKCVAKNCGIKVAESQEMTVREYFEHGTKIAMPYVVKPVSDGSSVGVFIVMSEEDKEKIKYDDADKELMIEKYVAGKELTVMCLQDKAYVVTELKADNEFYDYEAKYTDGLTKHVLPAEITDDVNIICLRYAEQLHKALKCETVSRTDFRWNEEDGVVLLEINTNPGMTSLSLVPEQAKYVGVSYEDLCEILVENAKCRKLM